MCNDHIVIMQLNISQAERILNGSNFVDVFVLFLLITVQYFMPAYMYLKFNDFVLLQMANIFYFPIFHFYSMHFNIVTYTMEVGMLLFDNEFLCIVKNTLEIA